MEKAFRWIVELLIKTDIPFKITGGFAARFYGSMRPLFDLDTDLMGKDFNKLLPFVNDYIISGPVRFKDEFYELDLLTLKYQEQVIDLSLSENSFLFNSKTNEWQIHKTDFSSFKEFEIYGLKVPVITWQELVEYKNAVGRPTDLEDLRAMIQQS